MDLNTISMMKATKKRRSARPKKTRKEDKKARKSVKELSGMDRLIIYSMKQSGMKTGELARKDAVSDTTIYRIWEGKEKRKRRGV